MAVTKLHSISGSVCGAIEYIVDGNKTRDHSLVESFMCETEPVRAAAEFRAVRQRVGSRKSTTQAQHIIQSFSPNEVTPEQAMEITQELCHRLLQEQYQYIIAIHTDHDHIHAHILVNNTNFTTGRIFETEHNQGRKSERAWAEIRRISDELCKEHNLSVIDKPKGKGVSHYEWEAQKNGTSWKEKLRQMIKAMVEQSADLSDFFKRCTECGIEYVYTPRNKIKLKFRLKEQGQQRFTRADTLGEEYTPEHLAEQIAERQKMQSAAHTVAEVKAPTPSKPIITPTAPPTTPKTEYSELT